MKTRRLFGLILVLSMMLLYVQYRLRRPAVSKIASIIHQAQKQTDVLMSKRRDPYRIYCHPPPAPTEASIDGRAESTTKLSQNLHQNDPLDIEAENQNIIFIAGHRAGGSTVQNILLRFALTRNLNTLLPITGGDFVNESHSQINMTQLVPPPRGQTYNILCHQTIFKNEVLSNLFPESSMYIGILRHPLNQSASAFHFYAQRQRAGKANDNLKYSLAFEENEKDPFRAFINKPLTYDVDSPDHSFTNNRQSIDLGFPITASFQYDKKNITKISNFVKEVDKTFVLVMISELFDESLVLLRRLLHWNMEDILYTKLSVSHKDYKTDIKSLSDDDIKAHRDWESMDYALYEHFRTKLEGLILAQGQEFQEELQKFREIQQKVKNFCRTIKVSFRSLELRIKPTEWNSGFCISPSFCDIVSKEKGDMTEIVRRHQLENIKIISAL